MSEKLVPLLSPLQKTVACLLLCVAMCALLLLLNPVLSPVLKNLDSYASLALLLLVAVVALPLHAWAVRRYAMAHGLPFITKQERTKIYKNPSHGAPIFIGTFGFGLSMWMLMSTYSYIDTRFVSPELFTTDLAIWLGAGLFFGVLEIVLGFFRKPASEQN